MDTFQTIMVIIAASTLVVQIIGMIEHRGGDDNKRDQ
jgi:hypothetical protein